VEAIESANQRLSPFLKWAGGKRWLVARHSSFFPSFSGKYIEPFLGSGAVFFHILPEQGILSDSNPWLIETYLAIRDDWERVLSHMVQHQRLHSRDYYYKVRGMKCRNRYTRAAQFLYLNRTCWNGLFRVNLKGEFNVPIGTKTKVIMQDDFSSISSALLGMKIVSSDFEPIIDSAAADDFLFVDPPYTVNHNLNGFIKYNEKIFSWEDQERLRDCLLRAKNRGVAILMTNADHESIKSLYGKGFTLSYVDRASVISGNSKFRGNTTELLIR